MTDWPFILPALASFTGIGVYQAKYGSPGGGSSRSWNDDDSGGGSTHSRSGDEDSPG